MIYQIHYGIINEMNSLICDYDQRASKPDQYAFI
jgi:hypothetical protein